MQGFGRIQKMTWRASAAERCRELARDMARFADPAGQHRPPTIENQPHREIELLIEQRDHALDRLSLSLEDLLGELSDLFTQGMDYRVRFSKINSQPRMVPRGISRRTGCLQRPAGPAALPDQAG